MTTAVQHFLTNLKRTMGPAAGNGAHSVIYKVTAAEEPFVGKQLQNCMVLERIGQGAMSVVYKARQDVTERIVAVKMLRVQLCCDSANVKRFQREARALSRLNHPNLLNVYHVGVTTTGQPFIVMDFIQGRSLEEELKRIKRLPWQRAAKIFSDVCSAMQHAHEQGVIHRDLKPENIMLVDDKDQVKVVDFGIVKITDESQRLSQMITRKGEVWGSPVYMSPEQCQGKELDLRTDIYSFGTAMYECLTGRQLYVAKNFTELVLKQLSEDPAPFDKVAPGAEIPIWFEDAVRKALAKDPINRFQSMAELKAALDKQARSAFVAEARPHQGHSDDLLNVTLNGGYTINLFIGEGGMSRVYRAEQKGTERVVAVKVLREELAAEESYVKRFEREAKSLARLSHPGLVSIFDIGALPTGQPYMVIEYLQGQSLHQLVIDHGKMPVPDAVPIFIQVCDVMNYAHKHGIIHRDMKPHNIMVMKQPRGDEVVKVVDFGIIKLDENIVSVSQKLTASGEICGSPMYMSPEQILDDPLDARTDIYSFGIVMYEMLSGRPLFGGNKITEVMNKHVNVRPQPLTAVAADSHIPDRLDLAVRRCLEKDRNKRFETMEDLKAELTDINLHIKSLMAQAKEKAENPPAPGLPIAVEQPDDSKGRSKFKKSRGGFMNASGRMKMIVAGAILFLLALGAGAFFLSRKSADQSSSDANQTDYSSEPRTREFQQEGKTENSLSGKNTHTHHKHSGARKSEAAEVMDATEKAHLRHNSGDGKDFYKFVNEHER